VFWGVVPVSAAELLEASPSLGTDASTLSICVEVGVQTGTASAANGPEINEAAIARA
jgi:hypothetical protein